MENKADVKGNIEEYVHLSFFVDVGKAIVSAKGLSDILNRIMEQIGKIFCPLNWSLLLKDPRADELVFKVVVGEAADVLRETRISTQEGISGWIARTGQSVIIEDVSKDKRFNDRIDRITGFTTSSIIGVPLKTGDKVLGVIELINKLNGQAFTPFELKVLSTIADFAAIAIEKEYYIRAIRKISRQDHLTGCLNRRSMDIILSREMERSRRRKIPLSILMLDIDDFKKINDIYGHLHGDEVLKVCADTLFRNVRKIDYVVRYGGDEFAVIMPDTDAEAAEGVRERIVKEIAEREQSRERYRFSASVGVSTTDAEGELDVNGLLAKTDQDMYFQKERKEPLYIDENLFDFLEDEDIDPDPELIL
ncbi:MAG: sensor domain-containing diguanylate cyclase [Spirochaetales bacterium]|nr:sensor domain-containing diguanylate cyclase [Spirochaetales bacterium]